MSRAISDVSFPRFVVPAVQPGWPEILSGILAFMILGFGGGAMIVRSGIDPDLVGLMLAALSGIAGLAAFAVAAQVRIRSWSAFGIRRVSRRWLLIGTGAGVLAFIIKGFAVMAFTGWTGQTANPQEIIAAGAGSSAALIVLSTVFMGILTPIGEEFLFRGVVTSALLRYGPVVGVVGSALIFAVLHGINTVFPAALVGGLVAGEVFRRSGSIWPAVMVHVVFNLPTIPIMVLASVAP